MTAALRQVAPADPVADAARMLGRRGGRPKGSFSPVPSWLRSEARQRQREGYKAREAFEILRDTEHPAGPDDFVVTDHTADQYGLDLGEHISWERYRKIWQRSRDRNR